MSKSNYAEDYEDVTQYPLDEEREMELREKQRECVYMWTNKAGEPIGVIMSYLETDDGRIWLTGSEQRARFSAIKRDPRSCVCITSTGTDMGPGKTVWWWSSFPPRRSFMTAKKWLPPRLKSKQKQSLKKETETCPPNLKTAWQFNTCRSNMPMA